MTKFSEEAVCLALHECDNDVERAADLLYDQGQSEWETTCVKKKKNRQVSGSSSGNPPKLTADANQEPPTEEWNDQQQSHPHSDKEKMRNKTGGSGGGGVSNRGRHNDNRGWRGREKQENERNLEDGNRQDYRDRRGRPGGSMRGGGPRGRGGGRAGGRYPSRNNRSNYGTRTIDTWDNSNTWDSQMTAQVDSWGDDSGPSIDDWSTEEYTGSLADTKVFTPSVPPEISKEPEIISRSPVMEDLAQQQQSSSQVPSQQSPIPPHMGSLNAAQTQYLNQLTQQNSDIKQSPHLQSQSFNSGNAVQGSQVYSNAHYGSTPPNSYVNNTYTAVNTNYGTVPETAPAQQQQQPIRTKTQRARVPPPSKVCFVRMLGSDKCFTRQMFSFVQIPSSAVEMPGDLNSVGYLDVQFGAMDLISDNTTFETTADTKFSPTNNTNLENSTATVNSNLDLGAGNQSSTLDAYSTQQKSNTQSSISSVLSQNVSSKLKCVHIGF